MDYTLNINGRLLSLEKPVVMGILNATPDSFYASSRQQTESDIAQRAREIIDQGGTIIDVGAYSTRPGHAEVTQEEEMSRLRTALKVINSEVSDPIISIDTFRPDVARMAVEEYGAAIINDVSEGNEQMFRLVARMGVPYILM
jgi:dihydropteroate synthase